MITLSRVSLFLLLVLRGVNVSYAQTRERAKSRSEALIVLRGCATRPITLGCDEDTAGYLIKLYERGDKTLLKPLMQAGLSSDGALAEILGDFYSNVLWKNPREFLTALRSHPQSEQKSLSWLAAATDGSGMGGQMLRDIRRNLRRIGFESGPLAPVARICLRQVEKVNAEK